MTARVEHTGHREQARQLRLGFDLCARAVIGLHGNWFAIDVGCEVDLVDRAVHRL
jgi:hypothetical protein